MSVQDIDTGAANCGSCSWQTLLQERLSRFPKCCFQKLTKPGIQNSFSIHKIQL